MNISNHDINIEKKDQNTSNKKKFYLLKLKMIIDTHCHLNYEPMSLSLKDKTKMMVKYF